MQDLTQQEKLEDDLDNSTDIEMAIMDGEMLEYYLDDQRGESCLLLGYVKKKPVHLVMGLSKRKSRGEHVLRIITVYVPQLPKWRTPRERGGRER